MTNERKKELSINLSKGSLGSDDEMKSAIAEAMREVMAEINGILNPFHLNLIPIYIAEFEQAASVLRSQFSDAAALADNLKQNITAVGFVYPMKK